MASNTSTPTAQLSGSVQQVINTPDFYTQDYPTQKAILSQVSQSFASMDDANQDQTIKAIINNYQAQNPTGNPIKGIGNLYNEAAQGFGNFGQGLQNLFSNPGQAINGIGQAFQTEAATHMNPLQMVQHLGVGAGLGVADLYNGLNTLPAQIGNTYLGKPNAQANGILPMIPTGGAQQFQQNHPITNFIGGLLPYIAADVATSGEAIPTNANLLGRLGKAGAIGAAYGGAGTAPNLGARFNNAANMGLLGLLLHGAGEAGMAGVDKLRNGGETKPIGLNGLQAPQEPQNVPTTEPEVLQGKVDYTRNDEFEKEAAKQLYHKLRAMNPDDQIAAQNKLQEWKKLGKPKVNNQGAVRYSKNPELALKQEQAQRILNHYERYKALVKAQADIEKARKVEQVAQNKQEIKNQQALDKQKAQELKAEIQAKAKAQAQFEKDYQKLVKEEQVKAKEEAKKQAQIQKWKDAQAKASNKALNDAERQQASSEAAKLKAEIQAKYKNLDQQAKEEAKNNKALNKAEAQQRQRELKQLKGQIKENQLAKSAAKKELKQVETNITRRERLLSEDSQNARDVLKTKLSLKEGLGYQLEPSSKDLTYEDIEDHLKNMAELLHKPEILEQAKADRDAMLKDKVTRRQYIAEIAGHTSTTPFKDDTPYAFFETPNGVGVKVYNENGHTAYRYYATADKTSHTIGNVEIQNDLEPFNGIHSNVYKGVRFYKIDDILNRPERDAEMLHSQIEEIRDKNPAMADLLSKDPKVNISTIRAMADALDSETGTLDFDRIYEGINQMSDEERNETKRITGC